MIENRSKWIESRREPGGKPIEIAENWVRRFSMECGAKNHLRLFPVSEKRGLPFLEILEYLDILEFLENPQTVENKGESNHVLETPEILERL